MQIDHIEVILELPQQHPIAQVSPATPLGDSYKRSGSSDIDKNNIFLMNALHLLIILVQVLLRAGFTCDKNFEATYFRARKFVPVCVTCASTDNLIGVIIENVQRNGRLEILHP